MSHDVFISYKSEQADIAYAVCEAVEAPGTIRCWIAPRDETSGLDYSEMITEAIKAARVFVLVFSDAAQRSRHVRSEIRTAFDAKPELDLVSYSVENVPPNSKVDYYLGNFHWIPAHSGAAENYHAILVRDLDKLLVPTAADPLDDTSGFEAPWQEEWLSGGSQVIVTLDDDAPSADDVQRLLLSCELATRFASSSWKLRREDYEVVRADVQRIVLRGSEGTTWAS